MTITYLLSFMDKVALGQASIFGIMEGDVSDSLSIASCSFPRMYSLIFEKIAPYRSRILMGKRNILLWISNRPISMLYSYAETTHREILWRHDCPLGRRNNLPGGHELVCLSRRMSFLPGRI